MTTYLTPPSFDYSKFKLPQNVNLDAYLGPHLVANDLPPVEELKDTFNVSDIVVKEIMGADKVFMKDINLIADGNAAALDRVKETENATNAIKFYETLFNTKARVLSADVPRFDPILKAELEYRARADRIAQSADFDRAVQQFGQLAARAMQHNQQRDQRILGNLAPAIRGVAAARKQLVAKAQTGPLAVSMFYGGVHHSLTDALEHKASQESESSFSMAVYPAAGADCIEAQFYARFLRGNKATPEDNARLLVHGALTRECMLPKYRLQIEVSGWGVVDDRITQRLNDTDYKGLRAIYGNRQDIAPEFVEL